MGRACLLHYGLFPGKIVLLFDTLALAVGINHLVDKCLEAFLDGTLLVGREPFEKLLCFLYYFVEGVGVACGIVDLCLQFVVDVTDVFYTADETFDEVLLFVRVVTVGTGKKTDQSWP